VEDGAAAYMFLAERLAQDRSLAGAAFNFSTEQPINVLDLTNLILRLMQSDAEPDIRNEATHEIRRQYLSAQKARELGWKPLFLLEDGLRKTIGWYQDLLSAAA
jgi:CDP-glucose 4,6-dehydratase